MRMTIIVAVSLLLAAFPLLIAFFFLVFTLPRKLRSFLEDVRKLRGTGDGRLSGEFHGPIPQSAADCDIRELSAQYFPSSSLIIPSFLLTLLYLAGFLLCDSYLGFKFQDSRPAQPPWLFPQDFVLMTIPLLYAFIGVYLFNLGATVRRLYLADITEQVFWGALNRLLLSMGLALVVMKSGMGGAGPWLYFSIGFLANIVLDWVLEKSLKMLNVFQPKQPDLPLQMVRGINIWKAYRLEEEAIENVQNLATADVLELAVRTHYNARTLVDWIDQSIVLARLTDVQVKALTSQAIAISAVELASASPENNGGDVAFANALAEKLGVDKVLMAATLDRLYEDEYVRKLWQLWQSGTEGPMSGRMRISLEVPTTKGIVEATSTAQTNEKPTATSNVDQDTK